MTEKSKLQEYLTRRILEITNIHNKKKRKYKLTSLLYILSIVGSSLLGVAVSITSLLMPVTTLSIISFTLGLVSSVLFSLTTKFDIAAKKEAYRREMKRIKNLNSKLIYIISTNGDDIDLDSLMKEILEI